MADKKDEYIVLEVTLTRKYCFRKGEINGWTTDEVIKSWFKDYTMGTHHATREACEVGNSERFIDVKILQPEKTK